MCSQGPIQNRSHAWETGIDCCSEVGGIRFEGMVVEKVRHCSEQQSEERTDEDEPCMVCQKVWGHQLCTLLESTWIYVP